MPAYSAPSPCAPVRHGITWGCVYTGEGIGSGSALPCAIIFVTVFRLHETGQFLRSAPALTSNGKRPRSRPAMLEGRSP